MKRMRESTVTVRICSQEVAATTVCISHKALEASSQLLGGIAYDVDVDDSEVTIDVKADDEWAVPIMADLFKNRETWSVSSASYRIFKDESSLTTAHLVNLYHTLDKYGMSWAMEAFHARLKDDVNVGLISPMTIFEAYREHPCISRLLVGMVKPEAACITSSQLKMKLMNDDVKCALLVDLHSENRDREGRLNGWYHANVEIICKIPKRYCCSGEDGEDSIDNYIPQEGVAGSLIQKHCERTRSSNEYGQWLKMTAHYVYDSSFTPDTWLGPTNGWRKPDRALIRNADKSERVKVFADLDEVCKSIGFRVAVVIDSTGKTIHKASGFETLGIGHSSPGYSLY